MGRVIVYNAISTDGFIAGKHGETPWSDEEWVTFQEFLKSCDICIMGRTTYGIMRQDDGFVEGPEYMVATSDPAFDAGGFKTVSIRTPGDLPVANMIGVIGGGDLNGRLAKLGLISEIILDIEPVILGEGMHLFGSHVVEMDLSLLSSKRIGPSMVQNHYKVEE